MENPGKSTAGSPKHHPIEKENHLNHPPPFLGNHPIEKENHLPSTSVLKVLDLRVRARNLKNNDLTFHETMVVKKTGSLFHGL